MAAVVVIPARIGSTRFPGKILACETGRPLVQHVVDQVRQCTRVVRIIVAADDRRIAEALAPFGTECVMTNPAHPSGTDRVAEVAARLEEEFSTIINVQGDEPEIEPGVIDELVERMETSDAGMFTAATPLRAPLRADDPNLVKVVIGEDARAMYFSRAAIPFYRDGFGGTWGGGALGHRAAYYLHVGIYAYRRETLIRLAGWEPTPCEIAEKLEQLRALEHGVSIGVCVIERATHGIDTPQQYQAFVQRHQQPATSN